ncbi:unnamed protein product [Haemonchus placei]|uniref:ShKT domain-containing protein n=1 Tax=Haemonchus placei TaxID=6290 RepID=A0A0N4VTX8_HAEPC|nr:unnamed protein product [Haemonchus placei]
MILRFVHVLLLLNAFTTEPRESRAQPCEDKGIEELCRQVKNRGQCHMGSTTLFAAAICAKTCEFCTTEKPKNTRNNKERRNQ